MARNPDRPGGESIVEAVRRHGITDPRILQVLSRVPRDRFVPPEQRPYAADDRALPIGSRQTISQPFIVALMSLEAALTGEERVLEIGTGSGYQTAVLAELSREVYTIERIRELSLRARGILDGLGITNVRYRIGDGSPGWPEEAPFDRVVVTAWSEKPPPALFEQLAEGGLIVAPLGPESDQRITVIRKVEGRPQVRALMPCRFVPLIEESE